MKIAQKTLTCECGTRFRPSTHRHKDLAHFCDRCYEVARLKRIEDDRKKQLATKKSELRKWFKWVCKEGDYYPSIKIHAKICHDSIHDLYASLVLEIEPSVDVEWRNLSGVFSGTKWPETTIINGYFRARRFRTGVDGSGFYEKCWKAGIPDERRSGCADRFKTWLGECAHKNRVKTHQIKMERDLLKRIQQTSGKVDDAKLRVRQIMDNRAAIKAQAERKIEQRQQIIIRERAQNERMRAAKKYKGSFFQMQAASAVISDYVKTTTQTRKTA